ncbi:hypothetical protein [Albimonas pacifica]|uniref:HEAT repeat domain-containing protein n=1 Tax=Albimonas pacifica TaxID=1114924 RepID=A0A1I3DEZ5_9RHOB|nr:hypothetical protein [Albimonas pacifica]SFH85223.1 hypothetical protein SAMN05216258_102548 [Albimonas pacifica]
MRRRAAALAFALGLAVGQPALSCAFDAWLPPLTLVDRLFDADAVALAVADPADPARWILVAAPPAVSATPYAPDPAAFLAAGADARPPALDADEAVLFAHDPLDDVWRRLEVVDRVTRPAVERILAAAHGWQDPLDPARFEMAAAMLGERDGRLRRLALRELDRAPYPVLRGLPLPLDADALAESLKDPAAGQMEPIHALLLGLAGGPRAEALVEGRLSALVPGEAISPATGAWAVALVELQGEAGVETLADRFLRADPRTLAPLDLLPVVEALAVQAEAASPALRARIVETLGAALEVRPDLVGVVARCFGSRGDYALGPAVQAALAQRQALPAVEAMTAAGYVFAARKAAGPEDGGGAAWTPD